MPYICEITGWNIAAAAEQTRRFAVGPGWAPTDSTFAESAVVSWKAPTQKIDISAAGGVTLSGDTGELVLANYPKDMLSAGPRDDLATSWVWLGRRACLYYVPAALWAARTLISTGILEQPIAELSQDDKLISTIRFPLRDARSLLDRPLQPTKYIGQQENLLLNSEALAGTATTAVTAPDGVSLAAKIEEDTSTGVHAIQQTVTVVASSPYTASVFVKAAERAFAQMLITDGVGNSYGCFINLTTGALTVSSAGTINGPAIGITSAGAGWWRVYATGQAPATTLGLYVGACSAMGTNSYAGTTGSGIYVWGAQLNYGTTPKAYIKTTTLALTGNDADGDPDVRGKVKPILYGTASNIPGVRVSQSKLIYQVADKSASIMCVRDGGAPLTVGTARATLASLQSTSPTAGTYDTYAGLEGTFIRLGTKPVKTVTIDAQEGASRLNMLLQSQAIDNASWGKLDATISANAIAAPDGTTTADKIQEQATTAAHGVQQDLTTVVGVTYTASVYLKAAERTFARLIFIDLVGVTYYSAIVNLTTGALANNETAGAIGTSGTYTITDAGSGWWRVTVTVTAPSISTRFAVNAYSSAFVGSYLGTAGSGIYQWGAQLEPAVAATTYIPTTTVAVAADGEPLRTHAHVWARMRIERCATTPAQINQAALSTALALDSHEVGFWLAEQDTTQLQAVNAVLASFSGYEVQALATTWKLAKLVAPVAPALIDILLVTPDVLMDSTDRALRSITKARPNFAPDGAPPYRVNALWGQNYTVMAFADFVGAASQRLKDKFATEWRTETATNTAIWNPATLTGPWTNAPELTIQTAYQPGGDGLTCPHAAAEAARALALYSALPGQYQVGFRAETTDVVLPGDVVSLKHPQMSLSAGPLFVVLQSSFQIDQTGNLRNDLVLGLQT